MRIRVTSSWIILALAALLLLIVAGCERENDSVSPAVSPDDADIFLDEFGDNVTFQAFAGSKLDALDTDASVVHSGTRSLLITVPDEGNPSGSFAGGAFTTSIARDLSGYDAVTFWAKASTAATLNVVGLGNDNTGTSLYMAETYNLELTTAWTKFIVPIPLPAKLDAEQGLFYFAEGPENGLGYQIWIDDLQFEKMSLGTPQPDIGTETVEAEIGEEITVDMATVTWEISGNDYILWAQQGYFSFTSSNTNVVEVAEDGTLAAVGMGTTNITAELGSVDADGQITVTVGEGPGMPDEPAPTPTQDAEDVISLFSNAYTNSTVDTWSADWDEAEVADIQIDGDDVKQYTDLVYAGIDFSSVPINATEMTHFYLDVWTPETVEASTQFKLKLVDFGADGVYDGGDDVESELTFTSASSPALESGTWIGFDIPLVNFTGLTTTGHVAQLIISGDLGTVYVDNIFFYDSGQVITDPEPTAPAPTPTHDAADVISLFSNVYTNVTVDTWSADWDNAELEDVQIAGNDTKKYTGLTVAGIEFTSETIDASEMTYFHMDFWTPDATSSASFKIKLVDFGANGVWDGGGDDVEHELTFTASSDPGLETSAWVSFDIPLEDFAGLTTTGHLAQLILSGDPNTVYIDNVYFHGGEVIPDPEPTEAAPAPTYPAASVISLFSDEYTNVTVNTWSADWDEAFLEDVEVAGNATKKYSSMIYAGIEFLSPTIDATDMTHFRMDIWTPDNTDLPAEFNIKLVDFGANGVWDGGGDDVEHELSYTASTTPALATGQWITFDIPLSEFTSLVTSEHMAQLVISGDLSTVYVDNVLFHN